MFKKLLLLLALGATLFTLSKPAHKNDTKKIDDYDFSEYHLDCVD